MKYFKSVVVAVFLSVGLIIGFTACPASDSSYNGASNSNTAVVTNSANRNTNTQTNTGNTNTNTQTNTGNTKMADNLRIKLDETISNWCPEHKDYTTETELKRIWVESGKHPWEYTSKGVDQLIEHIQGHAFFKNCPQANALESNLFDTGGEIQTFGRLYRKLYRCDPDNQ